LGIEPVVEVYKESDLKKAIHTKTKIIAVNARDLDTFKVNINKACKLLKKIPTGFTKLGFSGIVSKREIDLYKSAGAKGILIGTALMKGEKNGFFS
ncbi:MAG: indole-3-glycerol-phosphate synthase, partial [Patescibacteria group bacterium]|nr:indole-3-glycerol-phosphate synthase [Patescibacteria group bacterium]